MKTLRPLFLLQLLLLQVTLQAQLQWYQNQDGNNQAPNGTFATTVHQFNTSSFIACYQWQVINDHYTWKVSKTQTNGTELKTFYVDGTYAGAEVRVKKNTAVYVLKRDYPPGMNPAFTLYKLNSNLAVVSQRTISFPNGFVINAVNAFETDDDGNIYLAGDGQYTDGGGGTGYASFVLKTTKNLLTRWSRMDSVQTSYTRLHVDKDQKVTVVEDFYDNYPNIKVIRINAAGTSVVKTTVMPDTGRYSLFSSLDKNQDLLLYGGKMLNDTVQGIYFCKVSRTTGQVLFRKTQFTAPGSQLNDLKIDAQGRLFSMVTLYYPDKQLTKISRHKPNNAQVVWSRSFRFDVDSCQFARLVVNEADQFYAVGEKRCGSYYARGFAVGMRKNGMFSGQLPAPDSVAFQRYHSLLDGFIDNDKKLIAIGNTNDYDTTIYTSTYYRAFAVRFDENCNSNKPVAQEEQSTNTAVAEQEGPIPQVKLYPNPVQHQLVVSNMNPGEYDKLIVHDMAGRQLIQQKVVASIARLDVSGLADGVYLLVFRSSATLKERTLRFVVRK